MLFGEGHKYYNGTMSGEAAYSSRELRYLHHDKAIEGGMDFGNMLSLVIGQPDGAYYRVHKNFFEIPPGWFREIADQFLTFFQNHEYKELDLYYDRAGNNFEKQKEDYAGKIKDAIEKDGSGNRTGWIVNLKSRKQAVIRQDAEYDFMQELMGGTNKNLPILLVDAMNCKEMVSSVEKAKADILAAAVNLPAGKKQIVQVLCQTADIIVLWNRIGAWLNAGCPHGPEADAMAAALEDWLQRYRAQWRQVSKESSLSVLTNLICRYADLLRGRAYGTVEAPAGR